MTKEEQEFSIVNCENNYMENKVDYSTRRPGLHPSSASVSFIEDNKIVVVGTCMRQAWYNIFNVYEGAIDIPLNMKAFLGKQAEIGTLNRWKEMGIWIAGNVKFFNRKYSLSGELDAIIRNPQTDITTGVEIKSFYGYNANRSICGVKREKGTGNFIPGSPKEDQFLQAIVYRWEYKDKLEDYRLYYIERGDGHRLEFEVGFDQEEDGSHRCYWRQIPGPYWNAFTENKIYRPYTVEDIYKRYDTLQQLVINKQLPAKDYEYIMPEEEIEYRKEAGKISNTKYTQWKSNPSKYPITDWHCSYCDYRAQCEQDSLTF